MQVTDYKAVVKDSNPGTVPAPATTSGDAPIGVLASQNGLPQSTADNRVLPEPCALDVPCAAQTADVAAVDPAWGRLTAYQATGLACAGCRRSFLESERVEGQWIGPLDAVPVGRSPIDGFELRICQACADATDFCEEDGWQTARSLDQTGLEEASP